MGRTRTMTGALLAVIAASALIAVAQAQAQTPEWFECIKQQGGTYQKFCGAEGGKGGYIVKAGVGSGTLVAHASKLTIGGPRNPVTCSAKLEGVEQMPNLLSSVSLLMTSCHRADNTKEHCELQEEKGSEKEKQFESEPLEGELGYISQSPLKVGLKLTPVSGPAGIVFSRIYCVGPAQHFRLSGSFVAQIGGSVNRAGNKMALEYLPGDYLGEGEGEVDPPLEGEAAGGLLEELQTTGEEFGMPMASAVSGTQKASGRSGELIKA